MRLLIADDHPMMRSHVARTLSEAGFDVCAEVGDASAAVDAALREQPDVCVLDVRMPGDGIAAAREICARLPETRVVMLTVSRDDDDLFDALRAGAVGYLLKDVDPALLPAMLRSVVDGHAALPPSLVTRVVEEFRERGPRRRLPLARRREQLTSREWEVLELLRRGLGTSEIARRLEISDVTVRSHVAGVLRKLEVSSRSEAVRVVGKR